MQTEHSIAPAVVPVLVLALIAVGCSSPAEPAMPAPQADSAVAIVPGELPSEEAQTKMLSAKEDLFTKLSGRLMEVMGSQGPAAAIGVCKEEALSIAASVGEEHGLKIGRTGVRLRNTNNVAPDWAADLVRDQTQTPTFVALDNGDAAALLPIKLQGKCLMCHGPREQLAPSVQGKLASLYPDDAATGFAEGELRGWFWVQLTP